MKIRAAVVPVTNQLSIETIELDPPRAGEVLVRTVAAGVCHSDLHTLRGQLRAQPPLVLGHEGAGVVEQVGPGVTRVKVGDRMLVNWLPACESCEMCLEGRPNLCERLASTTFSGLMLDGTSRLRTVGGQMLKHYLSASSRAEYMVLSEASAIPFPADVPFEIAAIIGCAVVTGAGAAFNTARVRAGRAAAVIGCGGVGLSAILGCRGGPARGARGRAGLSWQPGATEQKTPGLIFRFGPAAARPAHARRALPCRPAAAGSAHFQTLPARPSAGSVSRHGNGERRSRDNRFWLIWFHL